MTDDKTKNTSSETAAPTVAEPEIQQDTAKTAPEQQTAKTAGTQGRSRNRFALISIIITVIAWVILSLNGIAALCVAVAGFVTACFGLKAATRAWRNTAVTSIVASSVLIVVISAFLIVIYIGLNSL